MGTILYTSDGEGLYDHEGYVAHILDDGSSAGDRGLSMLSNEPWLGGPSAPAGGSAVTTSGGPNTPDDQLHDQMLQDWERSHARPLLRTAERAWQLDTLAETVRVAEGHLRDGVREAPRRDATWDEIAAAIRIPAADARRLFDFPTQSTPVSGNGRDLGGGPISI